MKPRVIAELLAQYVERIGSGRDDTAAYLSLFHNHRHELAPLFSVVRVLRSFLVKVEPSPVFVETLGIGLRLAAQETVLERRHEEHGWTMSPSRRKMVLGAAALGSLAWLAAILVFSRSKTVARQRTAA